MTLIHWLLAGIGVLLGLVALAFLKIRHSFRRNSAYGQAASLYRAPQRIRLQPLEPFKWAKPDRAEMRVQALQSLGFEPLAGFRVTEGDGGRLFVLRHPSSGLLGIVQEETGAGTWTDIAFPNRDSRRPIYASSALKKSQFFLIVGDPVIHMPAAVESYLMDAVMKAAGRNAVPLDVNAANVANFIEEAYALAVDARLVEPMEDFEIRRRLKTTATSCEGEEPEPISDAEFARIKLAIPLAVANELRLACVSQFRRETILSAREWQAVKQRLLVIHDLTSPANLTGRHIWGAFQTKPIRKHLRALAKRSGTPRAIFAAMNAALPAWERYKKLGEVSRPVSADVYCAPVERPTT